MNIITHAELKSKLNQSKPNNVDRIKGYALIDVLSGDHFRQEHIPGSINIPQGSESEIESRFDKQKELIVYCASVDCPASKTAATELEQRGFTNVLAFEGGIGEWKDLGYPVEGEGIKEAA